MSTYSCTRADGSFQPNASSCEGCTSCVLNAPNTASTAAIAGVSAGIFFTLLVLSIVFWIFLLWFSIHVMKKCRGKPTWLNGTVIALLVFLFLLGWVPGLGLILLVGLLVLLLIYQNQCKNKK